MRFSASFLIITKQIAFILLALIGPFKIFAQDQYSARLSISGYVSELAISPSEEIWFATAAGNVYHTDKIGNPWQLGPFGSSDPYSSSSGNNFERINFFSENVLAISGFIQEDDNQNFIYWSENHGKDWKKVVFGKSSWLDAACVNANGKAWMSGSSQLIYFTADSGKTWKTFDKVELKGNLRFMSIYFAKDETTGLFGASWNALYQTTNNCQSWKKVPTPFTQNKYKRISKSNHPDISRIRIFGNNYIINQEGRVFITRSDTINWRYLPNVITFDVTEDERLFTVNKDHGVTLYDNSFKSVWNSNQKLDDIPRAIACKNGKLFALTNQSIYRISPKEFVAAETLTTGPIPKPDLTMVLDNNQYGVINKDILIYDKQRQQWKRLAKTSFLIGNAAVFNGNLVVSDHHLLNHFKVDPISGKLTDYNIPSNLFTKSVTELHFEEGSQGCFDSANLRRSYIKNGDGFVALEKSNSSNYLSHTKKVISPKDVYKLLSLINFKSASVPTIMDIDLSVDDILNYKAKIDKDSKTLKNSLSDHLFSGSTYQYPGANSNFEFYKSVADSLSALSPKDISDAFLISSGYRSTTRTWRRVIIVFEDKSFVIVENSDFQPKYLFTPWVIKFKGLQFSFNSIRFGQEVAKLTNGEFFDETSRDKRYAIFNIADYLYRKNINR